MVFWSGAALLIFAIIKLPALYGDYLWFVAVGQSSVFLTIIAYRIGLFVVTAGLAFLVLYVSYRVALRNVHELTDGLPPWTYPAGIVVVTALIGLFYAGKWDIVLRYLHATSFGVTDPIYGRDVAFYVYGLPVFNLIVGYLMLLTVAGLVLSLSIYARPFALSEREVDAGTADAAGDAFDIMAYLSYLREHAYAHVVAYLGILLVLLGAKFALDRYELVYSTRGTVFGIGATDAAVFQPLLGVLAVTAVLGGLVILVNARFQDSRAVYVPIAVLIGLLLVGQAAGFVYQEYVVEPDEFNKEEQHIENEIEFTNRGYALDRIEEREFPVSETLTREQIDNNPGTIENIRLWDPRPLLTTYNELQIFRTYYQFTDVDIDRYEIEGQERQVMVSAREIEFEALPAESQSWVNRHLVYTHGFGVAMSPVSTVTAEGLPELYIKDIPPNSSVGIEVTQPRIYYGEATTDYAIVNTETRELDYPRGGENVYTTYDGGGGVRLGSTLRKLVYAIKFTDPQIVLSDSVTERSRLQFNRDIGTRAPTIAPFLEYDDDPYVVVSNGKLYWIYDAYTTTDQYPYSNRVRFKGQRTNYVRNSVKVVIDAHTGETTYYVADDTDPLIQTYGKAFPGLFEDFEDMPADLREHVRYPEDAFQVQANLYLNYHMKAPQVFYNKEDAWRVPDEVARGEQIPMEPYYVIMTFPGEESPEFVMIQPYIPRGRENMIGWLAARSDPRTTGHFSRSSFPNNSWCSGRCRSSPASTRTPPSPSRSPSGRNRDRR
jgi:uncharacterized membrane protein (UPF0182 family)